MKFLWFVFSFFYCQITCNRICFLLYVVIAFFSCHAIDNPSMHSEITMLRQYGPNVPEETLSRLVKAFSELRTMADEGQIQVIISTLA